MPCKCCSPLFFFLFSPSVLFVHEVLYFLRLKCNCLSVTVPSCPEVFIVWRCTQALPVSSQMFHCGHSICYCQRCQAVVTMETVSGLNRWRCRSPGGTAGSNYKNLSCSLHFLLPGWVAGLWQTLKKKKKRITRAQPSLSAAAVHVGLKIIWATSIHKCMFMVFLLCTFFKYLSNLTWLYWWNLNVWQIVNCAIIINYIHSSLTHLLMRTSQL